MDDNRHDDIDSNNKGDRGTDARKYSPLRSERREASRERLRRSRPRVPQTSRARHISVRSELRPEPDMRKIARAVIQLALTQAEHDAHAQRVTGSDDAEASS